jgi:hypothetical protein
MSAAPQLSFCAERSGVAESITLPDVLANGSCDFAQDDSCDFAQDDGMRMTHG